MKFQILAYILLLQYQICNGQTIKDLFLELPIGGLSLAEKKQMINNFRHQKGETEKERPYLIEYQPNNFYLSYTGAYEGAETLNCWPLANGSLLVGAGYLECPGICNHDLVFYLKTEEKVAQLPMNHVIPEVTITDFFDTDQMTRDGVSNKISESDFKGFYGFMYHLPIEGKNIIVESLTHKYVKISSKLKEYDLGAKITLLWNDGTFIKQDKSELINKKVAAYEKLNSFSINNFITEFSMEDTLKTVNGHLFSFTDPKLTNGKILKLQTFTVGSKRQQTPNLNEDKLIYILEGTAELYLNGKTTIAKANTSFYCPSYFEYRIKNIGDKELKYLVFEYDQQ